MLIHQLSMTSVRHFFFRCINHCGQSQWAALVWAGFLWCFASGEAILHSDTGVFGSWNELPTASNAIAQALSCSRPLTAGNAARILCQMPWHQPKLPRPKFGRAMPVMSVRAVALSQIPGVPPSIRVIALAKAQETTPGVISVYLYSDLLLWKSSSHIVESLLCLVTGVFNV